MKNKFNVIIKPGFKVVAHVARAGHVTGIVSKIDTYGDFVKAYGKRVTLECGMSFACDDVVSSSDVNNLFYVEMTDTYGGEANYGWIKRFMVKASTMRGAISKVTRETGYHARKDSDYGDTARYNVPSAGICYFVSGSDGEELAQYSNVKEL